MTTLSDIIAAINAFTNTNGYPPDTIHITPEQQYDLAEMFNNGHRPLLTIATIYGVKVVASDTFAVAGTQP